MTNSRLQFGSRDRNNVLFIASAPPDQSRAALLELRRLFDTVQIDVIGRQESAAVCSQISGCEMIHVTGSAQGRLNLIRRLRRSHYQVVAFLEAGTSGFQALQAVAFLMGADRVVIFNETGCAIALNRTNLGAIFIHVGGRLRTRWPGILKWINISLIRAFLQPIGVIILLIRTLFLYFHKY